MNIYLKKKWSTEMLEPEMLKHVFSIPIIEEGIKLFLRVLVF